MGGKKLLVIYEKKHGKIDTKQLVSTLEKLQKKDKVEVKDYSFEEFAEKDSVDFWKAIIILDDSSNFWLKMTFVTGKFDPEDTGEYRVITESQGNPGTGSDIQPEKIISAANMVDISTWWPRVLYFLFPREHKADKTFKCLFLFDGNSLLQSTEELRWFHMMSAVLKPLGINCLWAGDVEQGLVILTQPNQATNVVVPSTGTQLDYVVVLSRNGGEAMFQKAGYYMRRSIKTIVITDDKKSAVCKEIEDALKKVYLYQTDNPLIPDYKGWSVVLRELKLIKCEDVAFSDKRRIKKILMTLLVLVIIFIVMPIILAIIAATLFLICMGCDVGQICQLCCCCSICCSNYCSNALVNVPFCVACVPWIRINDAPFHEPVADEGPSTSVVVVTQQSNVAVTQRGNDVVTVHDMD